MISDEWLIRNQHWAKPLAILSQTVISLYWLNFLFSIRSAHPEVGRQWMGVAGIVLGFCLCFITGALEMKAPGKTIMAAILFFVDFLTLVFYVIVGFAISYAVHGLKNDDLNPLIDEKGFSHDPCSCLYFSTITLTTVGYGDLAPSHASRFWAAAEAVCGLMCIGVFISSLTILLPSVVEGYVLRKIAARKMVEDNNGTER